MSNSAPLPSLLLGLLLSCALPAFAQEDGGDCKDHPLFTRMPNHYIYRCEHSQFEMRRFPVGPLNSEGKARLKEVEGEFWMIDYGIKDGATKASGLQVQRNFQNAARQAGGTVEGTYPQWCTLELDESFREGNSCTNYGTTLKLGKRGVAANRLMAKGYGQSAPIADNRIEDGRAKNRRVELVRK